MRGRRFTGFLILLVAVSLTGCRTPADSPAVDALITQAGKLDLAGQHDAAIALFRQALEREPASYDAHYGLARALDLAGRYDEARRHFTRAIDLATPADKDQAQRMMAIAWTFAGNVSEAARGFRQVFDRRVADGSFAGASEVANELGRVYLEHGDLDLADEWYRTGRETALREANLPAWRVDLADMRWAHARARIAARRGQADEAHRQEALVKQLLDKGGNDDQQIQYHYLLGYVRYHLGDDRGAIVELEQADQKDPFILLLIAQAHEKMGDQARAREYYRLVLISTSHAVSNAFARPVARVRLAS
jgi:tetratricopeptide (TPR) repeat protein